MRLLERKPSKVVEVRVKPHPICPHCGVVMRYNGRPAHSPRVTHYKCAMVACGFTAKLFDAIVPLSDISDGRRP